MQAIAQEAKIIILRPRYNQDGAVAAATTTRGKLLAATIERTTTTDALPTTPTPPVATPS